MGRNTETENHKYAGSMDLMWLGLGCLHLLECLHPKPWILSFNFDKFLDSAFSAYLPRSPHRTILLRLCEDISMRKLEIIGKL
jgi:hypothetical protein